ncbi:hypothetical protein M1146_04720 [Patescibacteria group bacterium]|nr:hypothetical protein [Patescibacteria group bacterium]
MPELEICNGSYEIDCATMTIKTTIKIDVLGTDDQSLKEEIFQIIPGSDLTLNHSEPTIELGGIEVPEYLSTKISCPLGTCYDITNLLDWVSKKHPGKFMVPKGDLMWLLTREIKAMKNFGSFL